MVEDTKIRILIADDHPIVRECLWTLLGHEENFEIVGEAGNGKEVVKQVRALQPQVVIMDIDMPDLNGIEATKLITTEFPQIKVIGLSMCQGDPWATQMLQAGATTFLSKNCRPQELCAAIRACRGP